MPTSTSNSQLFTKTPAENATRYGSWRRGRESFPPIRTFIVYTVRSARGNEDAQFAAKNQAPQTHAYRGVSLCLWVVVSRSTDAQNRCQSRKRLRHSQGSTWGLCPQSDVRRFSRIRRRSAAGYPDFCETGSSGLLDRNRDGQPRQHGRYPSVPEKSRP